MSSFKVSGFTRRAGITAAASLLSLFCLLLSSSLQAQTGVVTGTVVDAEIGEGLPGANVIISGTASGTATDFDGNYRLEDLSAGAYDLEYSYIGYQTKTVSGVEIKAGETVAIDVELNSDALELGGEVVVEAEAIRNAEGALLASRAKASSVSDAISAEAISQSGSSDAAAAMKKVTGASVIGGKYVYVRGLGERYSSTSLNGSTLPTADPDKKAVQFDIFPANLLDNIVTVKTFTPDKPGDFSGGLVDISTKSFPSDLTFELSTSVGYNTNGSLADEFLTYDGGETDWLAVDDGARDLPGPLEDRTVNIPSETAARFNPELAERIDDVSKSFNNVMGPETSSGPLNQSYSLSIGNRVPLGKSALGYVLGLTYSNSASFYDDGRTERWAFASEDDLGPDLLLNDSKATREVSMGSIANVAFQFGSNNKVSLNTLLTRSSENETRLQEGQWEEIDITDPNSIFINRTLGWTERELLSGQLKGEHYFPALARADVDWAASYGKTKQDEPDRRFVASTERLVGDRIVRTLSASGFRDPSRYFRDLEETTSDYQLNTAFPLPTTAKLTGKIKVGGAAQVTDRTFRERAIEIVPDPNISFNGDVFEFFSDENMGITSIDTLSNGRIRHNFGNTVNDATKAKNQYDGTRDIFAGYGMVDVLIARKLRLIGGARYETTELEVVSQDTTAGTGKIDETDILPTLNLVYHLTDRMNLRSAISRTLARPTFREVAPFESFDFLLGNFLIGNPGLDRSLIWNYDLRWEWFVRPGEILAVSAFYKNLENPIERVIIGGTNGQVRFENVPEATVFGLEFEVRSSLDRITPALTNFNVGFNLTVSESRIDIPGEFDEEGNLVGGELFVRRQFDPDADKRDLQGQSPYLFNANLSYEDVLRGTYAGFHFNVFGRRLSNVTLGATPDVFEQPVPTLDFTFSQTLLNHWKVKFSAKNLLNPDIEHVYDVEDEDFIYQSYTRGRSFSLGASYSL